ncbi:hypothetical protein D1007_21388 [Hordeum vulgare]|nr:hypothetical protein D1007_21388 [Hordeum vulgare]
MPSVDGFLLILLHALTVTAAVAGCAVIAAPDPPHGRVYTTHMSGTVVVSILQGAAAVLAFWELLTGEVQFIVILHYCTFCTYSFLQAFVPKFHCSLREQNSCPN